jgi:sigma-E factor negative regulatory protein RseC
MITEEATVLRCDGSRVWVAPRTVADCKRCAEGRGCGGGILGRLVGDRLAAVEVDPDGHDLQAGERVLLALSEPVLIRASLTAYLLPLACVFAGALAGRLIAPLEGDGAEVFGALAGLVAGLALARRVSRPRARAAGWQPRVIARLESESSVCTRSEPACG